jgi:hypothetical protein
MNHRGASPDEILMSQVEAKTQPELFREGSSSRRFAPTGIVAKLQGLDWLDWFAVIGVVAISARLYYDFWR